MVFFLSPNDIDYKFQKPTEKEIKIRPIKSRFIIKGEQYKNLKDLVIFFHQSLQSTAMLANIK